MNAYVKKGIFKGFLVEKYTLMKFAKFLKSSKMEET